MENEKELAQAEVKEVSSVTQEELAELLAESANLQKEENASDGVQADYILLSKSGSQAIKRSNDLFIPGLEIGEFYIQKDKKRLGKKLEVVPLAFVTLYNEKDSNTRDAKFFGVWNKEQAMTFPSDEAKPFNRLLPNGHILTPVNWVYVEVIGHPEIEKAVIAYKSTGNRIWRKWKEDAKARAGSSATLIYSIFEDVYKNDSYDWTDINFSFEGSLLDRDQNLAAKCLKKSNAFRQASQDRTLIPNRALEGAKRTEPTMIEASMEDVEDSSDEALASF